MRSGRVRANAVHRTCRSKPCRLRIQAQPLHAAHVDGAKRLDPRRVARVYRSAIINVRRVEAVHPWFNGYHVLTMETGQKLRMSRYQHDVFLRLVSLSREASTD